MKVLMITTSYPDYEGSNRGIFIRRLCRELVDQGARVMVLTPRVFRQSPLFEEEAGIKVYRFRYPSGSTPLNQLEKIPVFAMAIYMLSGFFRALALILREKPDVIHGNWIVPTGLIASLAGLVTRTPVINTARGMDVRVSERGPVRFLFDLAVRLSDKVTVVSEAMKERIKGKDAEVISSGVDPGFFSVAPDYNSKTVLHIRALEQIYDVQTLIRAIPAVISKIHDARFVIAGRGSQETFLKGLSVELGIDGHVEFLGALSNQEIASLMGRASVYVSAATADGTSIALLEAIAAGLVPVVTNIEANRVLIAQGVDGYLFEKRNAHDLADKVIQALSKGIAQDVLRNKSREFMKKVSWSSVANRFVTGYKEVRSGSGRGRIH